jgi:hypothetical protein
MPSTNRTNKPSPTAKRGWRVREFAAAAGISRSSVFELIADKKIESVKHGASRIILTAPETWLASLKRAI